jgi:hypothetical protein
MKVRNLREIRYFPVTLKKILKNSVTTVAGAYSA